MKRNTRNSAKGQIGNNKSIKPKSPTVANVNKNLNSQQSNRETKNTRRNDQITVKEVVQSPSAPKKL